MQSLPQKRRTLSTGLSQYQHDPFGGRLTRDGLVCTPVAGIASDAAPLLITLSCIVSKVPPYRQYIKSSSNITLAKYPEHEQAQGGVPVQQRCHSRSGDPVCAQPGAAATLQ